MMDARMGYSALLGTGYSKVGEMPVFTVYLRRFGGVSFGGSQEIRNQFTSAKYTAKRGVMKGSNKGLASLIFCFVLSRGLVMDVELVRCDDATGSKSSTSSLFSACSSPVARAAYALRSALAKALDFGRRRK
jgi:hypothetical protein